jgi:hypothetical protein
VLVFDCAVYAAQESIVPEIMLAQQMTSHYQYSVGVGRITDGSTTEQRRSGKSVI